jgi:hypothetical protein
LLAYALLVYSRRQFSKNAGVTYKDIRNLEFQTLTEIDGRFGATSLGDDDQLDERPKS